MFEDAEPVDINPSLFDSVLARLDEVQEDRAANDSNSSTMSWTVKQIRKGNLDDLPWKKVTRSLRIADLGDIDGAAEFSLYHIAEGGRIPQHNHSGTEMTLVLQGGFSDESGSYHAGDFITREAGDIHAADGTPRWRLHLSGGSRITVTIHSLAPSLVESTAAAASGLVFSKPIVSATVGCVGP